MLLFSNRFYGKCGLNPDKLVIWYKLEFSNFLPHGLIWLQYLNQSVISHLSLTC